MAVNIYDTRARSVVPLDTREPGHVRIYLCGPTVYNYIHIGNARTTLWFDQIRRYLTYRGFLVTFVLNYTDVDDKIIERSKSEGLDPDLIARKYAAAYEADMAALGVRAPDALPRATAHIDDMVAAIQALIDGDVAYEVDGDVFFAIERFADYGKLSGRSLDDMRAGERVEPHAGKRHPLDFALWKAAKEGEPSWSSPWGPGRPGWHIECSVMSTKYLGMGFDIHGGATDLIFPHHENELAQAEALGGGDFVRHWVHSGLVQMGTEKMSKSLGNFVLTRDVVKRYGGEIVRYWALTASYRTQATFSENALDDAAQGYERWSTFLTAARHVLGDRMPPRPDFLLRPLESAGPDDTNKYIQAFVDAMDDDFNSAQALAAIHDLVREGNKLVDAVGSASGDEDAKTLVELVEAFLEMTSVLGFEFSSTDGTSDLLDGVLTFVLELREKARAEGRFEDADAIRARLEEAGVTIEDTAAGPRWRL